MSLNTTSPSLQTLNTWHQQSIDDFNRLIKKPVPSLFKKYYLAAEAVSLLEKKQTEIYKHLFNHQNNKKSKLLSDDLSIVFSRALVYRRGRFSKDVGILYNIYLSSKGDLENNLNRLNILSKKNSIAKKTHYIMQELKDFNEIHKTLSQRQIVLQAFLQDYPKLAGIEINKCNGLLKNTHEILKEGELFQEIDEIVEKCACYRDHVEELTKNKKELLIEIHNLFCSFIEIINKTPAYHVVTLEASIEQINIKKNQLYRQVKCMQQLRLKGSIPKDASLAEALCLIAKLENSFLSKR